MAKGSKAYPKGQAGGSKPSSSFWGEKGGEGGGGEEEWGREPEEPLDQKHRTYLFTFKGLLNHALEPALVSIWCTQINIDQGPSIRQVSRLILVQSKGAYQAQTAW